MPSAAGGHREQPREQPREPPGATWGATGSNRERPGGPPGATGSNRGYMRGIPREAPGSIPRRVPVVCGGEEWGLPGGTRVWPAVLVSLEGDRRVPPGGTLEADESVRASTLEADESVPGSYLAVTGRHPPAGSGGVRGRHREVPGEIKNKKVAPAGMAGAFWGHSPVNQK